MLLFKTTILPTDDVALAKKIFWDLVEGSPEILFVAVGTDPEINNIVEQADIVAGGEHFKYWRRIVWLREKDLRHCLFSDLEVCESVPSPTNAQVAGFFIDYQNRACDAIMYEDLPVKKGRLIRGFFKGEESWDIQ